MVRSHQQRIKISFSVYSQPSPQIVVAGCKPMIGGLHEARCVIVRLVVHNDNRVKSVVHGRQRRGLPDNWSECAVGQSCMQPRASPS